MVHSNKKVGRITGVLFLFIFFSGILVFQFLQGPVLFSKDFLSVTSENANQIISSVVLGIFSGIASIAIATLLLPIFKKHNGFLAYLYFAFSILGFISIMIDNVSVITLLELSKEYVKSIGDDTLSTLGTLLYRRHWWTHYFYLLISCFPVFILYYTLYTSRLVPRVISIFGIIAALLMFAEEILSIFGHGIGMNMLLPIGLIQLILPLWLILKGLKETTVKS